MTTLLASDPESDKYIVTRGGNIVGYVVEARYNAEDPLANGLIFYPQTDLDNTPFTLKKRPDGDYSDTNLELIFTNEV